MNRFLRFLGPLFALIVFAGDSALRRELQHIHYQDVRKASCWTFRARDFLSAVALTALNYVVLLAYNWVSVRYLRLPLGMGKTALASFIGHVSSFNFGAVLGGTPVRYRLYTAFGLSGGDIVKLIALSTATFWIGFLALAGLMFLWDPLPLPSSLHMPFDSTTPIGLVLIAITLGYLAMSYVRVTLRWHEWEFILPPLWLSLVQLVIAATDLLIASAVLHVLLPKSMDITFGYFLAVYLLAVVTVLFTHVPAGAGVLEFVMLLLLAPLHPGGDVGQPAGLSRRLLSDAAGTGDGPFGRARVGDSPSRGRPTDDGRRPLGAGQSRHRCCPSSSCWPELRCFCRCHAGRRWAPGMVECGSAAGSHRSVAPVGQRLRADAGDPRPRFAVAARQCLLAFRGGADLWDFLFAGAGIRRRASDAALRGAGGAVALSALLLSPRGPAARTVFPRLVGGDRRHRDRHGLADRLLVQTRRILRPVVVAIRAASRRTRSLRAAVAVALAMVVLSLAHLLRAVFPKPHPASADETAWARQIVAASGRAADNVALSGDKWLLFNGSHTAVVMYRVHQRLWMALGDPVGPASERTELAWQFRDLAEHYGGSTAFFSVDSQNLPLYLDMGLWPLQLGEEARVRLADFSLAGPPCAALAETHEKLAKVCRFEVVPAADVPPLVDRLRPLSDAYLVARHATEQGFLSGFFDPRYLAQFPLALVHSENRIVAFANLWPAAGHEELAVDLLRYPPTAHRGHPGISFGPVDALEARRGLCLVQPRPVSRAGRNRARHLSEHHAATFPLASGSEVNNAASQPRVQEPLRSDLDAAIFGFARRPAPPPSVFAHLASLVDRNPLHKRGA